MRRLFPALLVLAGLLAAGDAPVLGVGCDHPVSGDCWNPKPDFRTNADWNSSAPRMHRDGQILGLTPVVDMVVDVFSETTTVIPYYMKGTKYANFEAIFAQVTVTRGYVSVLRHGPGRGITELTPAQTFWASADSLSQKNINAPVDSIWLWGSGQCRVIAW